MLKKAGEDAVITDDQKVVAKATKIILPGVGHFDFGMRKLRSSTFYEALNKKALEDKVPVLGICLGAQMLLESSEEGNETGLGWIKGKNKRFDFSGVKENLPVPNMGWQDVHFTKQTPLNAGIENYPRYYFVHSYVMGCDDKVDVLGVSHYGYDYTVAVQHQNIYGVQFHPEKSHRFGMQLLKNFAQI